MTVSMRLTVTMAGLVLVAAIALGFLARAGTDLPVLFAGLAIVLAILILTVMVAHHVSRPIEMAEMVRALPHAAPERVCTSGDIGFVARAVDRIADEKGDDSAKLTRRPHERRRTQSLEQYAGRERIFIAAVESASYPVIAKASDGTASGDGQVENALSKSRTSFGSLVAAVHDRLALRSSRTFREVA
jgi:hypothetical protein